MVFLWSVQALFVFSLSLFGRCTIARRIYLLHLRTVLFCEYHSTHQPLHFMWNVHFYVVRLHRCTVADNVFPFNLLTCRQEKDWLWALLQISCYFVVPVWRYVALSTCWNHRDDGCGCILIAIYDTSLFLGLVFLSLLLEKRWGGITVTDMVPALP